MHEKELMKEADLSMLEVFKQNQNQTQKGLMEEIKMTESQSRYGIMDPSIFQIMKGDYEKV